jgi:hypothetical protein
MYFRAKNTLNYNHYDTLKHPIHLSRNYLKFKFHYYFFNKNEEINKGNLTMIRLICTQFNPED